MGQQQILLIVVGVVIVGIAVAVGVTMFNDQAAATNRDEVANDVVHMASVAQSYYRRPVMYGGGGRSFNGLTMARITKAPSNMNGQYTLSPDPASGDPAFVTLTGTGVEVGSDPTKKVTVVVLVYPDSVRFDATNGN
jgi:Tfp pilus assembly protein PilE